MLSAILQSRGRAGFCTLALVAFVFFGCAQRKYAIVYGESAATTAEAVQEAKLAVENARRFGYRPVSVGGGAGAAGDPEFGGRLVNIYILLEGPANAPDILPETGNP